MIYITGDIHKEFSRFTQQNFPEQKEMSKEDYVICCGDFGGIWSKNAKEKEENYWLDWLEKKNFTFLFVDGNHENFDRLHEFPVSEWHGGKVHKIRESVIHLMRGQVYDIDGYKFFTFGGAASHDLSEGVLEPDDPDFKWKAKRWEKEGRWYRVNHESWWKEELPSEEEMQEGIRTLEKQNWKVDFIITHCGPSSLQEAIGGGNYENDKFTDYLEMIHGKCNYQYWFFGHYHQNANVNEKDKVIYEQMIRV